jgi:hypothetical protein
MNRRDNSGPPWNVQHPALAAATSAIPTGLVLGVLFRQPAAGVVTGVVLFFFMLMYNTHQRDRR